MLAMITLLRKFKVLSDSKKIYNDLEISYEMTNIPDKIAEKK